MTKAGSRKAFPKLRKLCLALPEAHEKIAWGEPTFRVKNKMFATYAAANNHHGDGRESVWVKSSHANQELMVRASPEKFFVPPYLGPSGWIGVYLDGPQDWKEVAVLLEDAYRMIAPKKLLAELEAK